ncbi:peptidoglycan editing factor PgeF [Piscinibacter sakaiensis]|uniref:peptidoglycan editing factor PgeF n=1 Tax=Piscinibacter sakaiensis TaxID=1547922 RepID=UPI003AAA322A
MRSAPADDWLRPQWQQAGVDALMTSRNGGVGKPPFDSFNLRRGIGDDDDGAVAANLQTLRALMPAEPVWLDQVHGNRVVRLTAADAQPGRAQPQADASVCTEPGIACVVQVADCLPVLMAAGGRGVAAAHAGWRGLAGGVLEATITALCEAADCRPGDIEAWLGACIGPQQFEVGADVLAAFGADAEDRRGRFRPRGPAAPGKWLADLPGLAEDRLRAAGVGRISSAGLCTVESSSRFFSYRRDRVTGRMAAGIWLTG